MWCRRALAPARHPLPLPAWVSVIEPDLRNRSNEAGFLKPREEAGGTIFVGFDFHNHETLLYRIADSLLYMTYLEAMYASKSVRCYR